MVSSVKRPCFALNGQNNGGGCFHVACSQTLYFLFKVLRALVIKYKNRWDLLTASARG